MDAGSVHVLPSFSRPKAIMQNSLVAGFWFALGKDTSFVGRNDEGLALMDV